MVGDLDVILDVVGEGPDRAFCEELVRSLGLTARVNFHGSVARETVDSFYDKADIFVFPSYREPGGNVIFEAMGHGLPIITTDRGGPGAATDDLCAVRLAVSTPEQLSTDLGAAIRQLAGDAGLRGRMGAAARVRVSETGLWSQKICSISRLFKQVLDNELH